MCKYVRIVPMSMYDTDFEGKDVDYVQNNYFKDDLINANKGWYYYGKNGIEANDGDLLLFQMENNIVASAEFLDIIRFKKMDENGSNGAIILNCKTVKIFKPISKEELSVFIPDFKKFNQTKYMFSADSVDMVALNKRFDSHD